MRKIQFADFELDFELFKLSIHDTPIEIGARAIDLLIYLIEHRERVVENEELREHVWQAAALSPSSIPTCVRELRIALRDDANNPKLIETARGRGYRFIGKVSGLWVDEERDKPLAISLPFVGRIDEINVMDSCLRSVIAEARCRILLVRGEAGIGKTRLLSEFYSMVSPEVITYFVKSPSSDGALPYWPWTQILREALAEQRNTNEELVNHAQILSTAFPEIDEVADLLHTVRASLDRHYGMPIK